MYGNLDIDRTTIWEVHEHTRECLFWINGNSKPFPLGMLGGGGAGWVGDGLHRVATNGGYTLFRNQMRHRLASPENHALDILFIMRTVCVRCVSDSAHLRMRSHKG